MASEGLVLFVYFACLFLALFFSFFKKIYFPSDDWILLSAVPVLWFVWQLGLCPLLFGFFQYLVRVCAKPFASAGLPNSTLIVGTAFWLFLFFIAAVFILRSLSDSVYEIFLFWNPPVFLKSLKRFKKMRDRILAIDGAILLLFLLISGFIDWWNPNTQGGRPWLLWH